jgi:hypothetical protein
MGQAPQHSILAEWVTAAASFDAAQARDQEPGTIPLIQNLDPFGCIISDPTEHHHMHSVL